MPGGLSVLAEVRECVIPPRVACTGSMASACPASAVTVRTRNDGASHARSRHDGGGGPDHERSPGSRSCRCPRSPRPVSLPIGRTAGTSRPEGGRRDTPCGPGRPPIRSTSTDTAVDRRSAGRAGECPRSGSGMATGSSLEGLSQVPQCRNVARTLRRRVDPAGHRPAGGSALEEVCPIHQERRGSGEPARPRRDIGVDDRHRDGAGRQSDVVEGGA